MPRAPMSLWRRWCSRTNGSRWSDMHTAAVRRLPGIRFEPRAAALSEALPRMDVAVLVGFASSGPIDLPVAIESPAQFEAIFGHDAALAWDVARGRMTNALLGPTVRAFFSNGGRRCWIVRVAGDTAVYEH